jgi:hypothetical protein
MQNGILRRKKFKRLALNSKWKVAEALSNHSESDTPLESDLQLSHLCFHGNESLNWISSRYVTASYYDKDKKIWNAPGPPDNHCLAIRLFE